MKSSYTFEQIARGLFLADPMNTACVENEMTDEYDRLASRVCELEKQDNSLTQALRKAFDESFWSGALTEEKAQSCLLAIQRAAND